MYFNLIAFKLVVLDNIIFYMGKNVPCLFYVSTDRNVGNNL